MEKFLRPEDIIEKMSLYGPMMIADFGAGAGHFSIPAAKHIASDGKVFALDIQEEPLHVLRKHAHALGIHNIHTMRADLERPGGSHLQDESIDLVIIAHILFQAEHKKEILREAFRVLKKGGRIVLVEWSTDTKAPLGPRHEHRVSKKGLEDLLKEFGHQVERVFDLGDHHHGTILKKS